jgi:phosphoribosylaminoimidazole-succinocarboxamide synthase
VEPNHPWFPSCFWLFVWNNSFCLSPLTPANKATHKHIAPAREHLVKKSTAAMATPAVDVVVAATESTTKYLPKIKAAMADLSSGIGSRDIAPDVFPDSKRYRGKVRDVYVTGDKTVLIATGRQSAFDRALATVPYKGQVLSLTSLWWFENSKNIVPNHIIASPHPNVVVCKKCSVFQVEFVVRGYMTGSTNTSMWTYYKNGTRNYCGHDLPDGMVKNQKLWTNLVTPTTKDAVHDEPISAADVVKSGRMTQEEWDYCAKKALELFAFGQKHAESRGLILVDTKYEFGKDAEGNILLADEVHTPDSSRYWVASSYKARIEDGKEPENIDKEFLRLWFRDNCDPYKDATLPEAPEELVAELSRRYIMLYELITGETFSFDAQQSDDAVVVALKAYFNPVPQAAEAATAATSLPSVLGVAALIAGNALLARLF